MDKTLSILMIIENNTTLKEDIEKLSNTKMFHKEEILLLDISKENILQDILSDINKNYNNIKYIRLEGKNKSEAYNKGILEATGEYLSFLEQGNYYSKNALKTTHKYIKIEKAKIIAMKSIYLTEDGIHKTYKICPTKDKAIDLKFNPCKINLSLNSYFINSKLLENIKFDEKLQLEDASIKFILQVLNEYPLYYLANNDKVYYNKAKENDTKLNQMQYDKDWYTQSIKNFVLPFLKEISTNNNIPLFIQEGILYYIFTKYNCNLNEKNKSVLDKKEAKEFFKNVSEALKYIDTEVIMCRDQENLYKIPRWLAYQFVLSKNNIDTIKIEEGIIKLIENKNIYEIGNMQNEHINIYTLNYEKDKLNIDFTVSVQDFLKQDEFNIKVKYAGKEYTAKKTKIYPLQKCFDLTISNKCTFSISIPIQNVKKADIQFYLEYAGKEELLEINFVKIQAHLTKSKYSYWKFKDFYLEYRKGKLVIEKKSAVKTFKKEISYMLAKFIVSKNKERMLKYIALRTLYWLYYPIMKNKRIWIYFDKIYKGGDNAEYLYKYASKQNDNIKHYYVINKASNDYKRLKKEKANILIFGSKKLRIYSLYAEVILATHKNVISFLGFTKPSRKFFQDLFNPEIVCIQHGLTMQAIAQHQNRLEDNTKLYMCASKYEIENLSKDIYGYDKDKLKLVGLARFDGLMNNDKKQILISPTWRKNAANTSTRMGNTREYTEEFKNSEYFKIFNDLINNKKLIDSAKKDNYKIIFMLHPVITAQEKDFEGNDFVKILTVNSGISYEQLLTESSLMVTDYSGIQYDFAYMRKPIIYFHPDELPAQYEDGGINYETMGFGPICKKSEELVELLCEYMDNECKTEEKYIKRADDFFAFDDHNNCERIYNEIKKYMDERK